MRKALKTIDFYKAVPSQLSEGTISGACISFITVAMLILMTIAAVTQFMSPRTHTDMIVDQKHLQQKIKVNIDIEFPAYPCSLLSLDIENILRVHLVNIGETIKKFNLHDGSEYVDATNRAESKKRILEDLKSSKGCKMVGFFEVDPVPGNFHFSCHGYGGIMQEILNNQFRDIHKKIDMSHKINHLYFGQIKKKDEPFNNFESRKEISEEFLGISYTYFLDIVEHSWFLRNNKKAMMYRYTARMNEVILGSMPIVLFRYETNPISVITIKDFQQWHVLFVKLVGIIGGIFTVATIMDSLVHSSIRFLVEKHRLGKLK